MTEKPNRLIHEKSPYLLQHAYNPVDWFPWGQGAFEKARRENKPIFLSVGYSTCHWCHVMEHESFEDEEVARLMNEVFVSIKVDREERPDIDNIYMTVCQVTTGSGGWPLTIIMTPEQKPFFAATYIPKHDRFGRPGMMQLIPRIREIWAQRQGEILNSADQLAATLQQIHSQPLSGEDLNEDDLNTAYLQLYQRYDETYGGFGTAPKFPTPHQFSFLLRYWKRMQEPKALEMVENTLLQMRNGGIYDQLGFGFHRYSTDRYWLVPHFEKMLYDQALLALAYTETYQATHKGEYKQTAEEILTYVLRDMTDSGGGFYSAEDADSEGVEGKFYLWTVAELPEVLGGDDSAYAAGVFQLKEDGNFIDSVTGHQAVENILHLSGATIEDKDRFESARKRLFLHREKRIHPYKDDKILTDWNGLMIATFARAGAVFQNATYTEAACQAADFILSTLRKEDGSLLHRFRESDAAINGTLDDYAFVIHGLLELFETSFHNMKYLEAAMDLQRYMNEHFWDDRHGGYFLSSDVGEKLLLRSKEIYDGAVPSGNSVAMLNLLRLARITGGTEFEEKASAISKAFAAAARENPAAHTQLMIAVDFSAGPSAEVVIIGRPDQQDASTMIEKLHSVFAPNKVVIRVDSKRSELQRLIPFIKEQKMVGGKATAYVCRNFVCNRPTTDADEMVKQLL